MIFLVALIMPAILAWMLSRSLARPVERMMQTVTRISQGEFSRNHPVMLGGASEMDTLERHIGDMGDSMERLLHTQLEREQEKRALEIRMLQNQLNPHFLYNTLNTIKLMAALQGKTAIQNMIEALGRLLRANLSAGEEQIRPVSYTHLDVYKRQSPRCSTPAGRKVTGIGIYPDKASYPAAGGCRR